MSDLKTKTQVAIIGAGPGGYPAAFLAADLGLEVTIIDPEDNPGGVCLYRGCIPSKALLHSAKVISEAEHLKNLGITFSKPKIDLDKLRDWKNNVVEKLVGGLGILSRQRKITYIQGRAKFVDSETLEIKKTDGEVIELKFEHAVIATGSRPAQIPGFPNDSPHLLNSTSALDLPGIPKTMLVVGGGYIGLELGTVYAALGTKVSVVEMTSGLMQGADRDLVRVLQKSSEPIYEAILLDTKVVEIEETKKGIKVTFEGEGAEEKELNFDKVLVSVGRKPNSENLGLENTKVEIDSKGFITIDAQRRTADRNIFAIGDVAGEPMLAHKATHEGRTVAEVIAGRDVAFEPNAIPAVVFTDPEIAWCGLTETEAKEKKINIKVARFPWGASGRATTLDRNDGVTKLIIDPETDRVLGMGIVGPGAGELIAEGVLAIEMGALASDLELTIHAHPTLSETVMESAEVYYGLSTHMYKPKRDR
ncbi:MAG: dihydrolipoyl dehydrogenase [Thermodesulfobacteriota bacterium]|nr:MAG: dihydrolipoyl dehydrogenase [Thermodesulfobacteriota bacterium]